MTVENLELKRLLDVDRVITRQIGPVTLAATKREQSAKRVRKAADWFAGAVMICGVPQGLMMAAANRGEGSEEARGVAEALVAWLRRRTPGAFSAPGPSPGNTPARTLVDAARALSECRDDSEARSADREAVAYLGAFKRCAKANVTALEPPRPAA